MCDSVRLLYVLTYSGGRMTVQRAMHLCDAMQGKAQGRQACAGIVVEA